MTKRPSRVRNGVERRVVCDETPVPDFDPVAAAGPHHLLEEEGVRPVRANPRVGNGAAEAGLESPDASERLPRIGLKDNWPVILPAGADDADVRLEGVEPGLAENFLGETI